MSKDFLIRVLGDASKGIDELDKFAKKADDLTHVGQAGMVMGGLIAAGIGVAVAKYAEFDAAMSNVVATGEDAAENQDALRQAAMNAGASTVFSATEAANAIEELAKAGVSAENTLSGGLNGALDLAAAGGLGVADAATIMATSMNQFAVRGRDATHVADLLAAGAGKAQGDVTDMSQALAQAGLVANATGLSIEETTGGLAAFASAGLLGSDAGTSFKSMLQRLTPQSAEAQSAMDELKISAYDAGGNFIGLSEFAGVLQSKMRDLTPEARSAAMATIFGSDAVRAATILYNQGAEGISRWTSEVNDQGYAAETARARLNNLQGDVEALGGAIDTALIKQGSGANDSLRALTSAATSAVTWFSELPEPVQQTGLYLGVAAAAVGLFGGAGLTAVPKIIALKAAVDASKFSMTGLSLAAGGVTVGLAAVIAIVAAVAAEQAEARARAQAYADTLEKGSQRITTATRDMAKEALAADEVVLGIFNHGSAYDAAERLGISFDLVTDAATGNAQAMAELQEQIDSGSDGSLAYANSAVVIENAVRGESASIEEAIGNARQKESADRDAAAASENAAVSSGTAAAAYMDASEKTAELTEELDKLVEAFNAVNGVGQDAVTTNARWRESLAGIATDVQSQKDAFEQVNGTVSGFSLSLDENTVSGSANAAMLAGVASDAQKAAEAQYEVEKSTIGGKAAADNYAGTLAAQRQAFIDAANGAGYNADQVQILADKVFSLPPERAIKVLAETGDAIRKIEQMYTTYDGRTITVPVRGSANWQGPGLAGGGEVHGPGTGTSDSIMAWLSDGEFVVKESVASKNIDLLHHLNGGGRLPAYKGGGPVGLAAASSARVAMLPLAGAGRQVAMATLPSAPAAVAFGAQQLPPIAIYFEGDAAPLLEQMDLRAHVVVNENERRRATVARMGRQPGR